ncbi:MAG: hypothetical protein LUE64_01390 [Candidatus Gastranaerophilales bacterium]|nr:hypothetical protein [Candidatus Gastranaerophilales bacterium]
MKRVFFILGLFLYSTVVCFCETDETFDLKQNAFALYNTGHINEARMLLDKIKNEDIDSETLLIKANIEQDLNNDKETLKLLKLSVEKNKEFYKGYYNLGCFYMGKRIYARAAENFELSVKYNKQNPFGYYNLAAAQLNLGEYKAAKKNLIKAIMLKNDEKNFYYNLAYANKKLDKKKDAEKIIDFYNQNFAK